MPPLLEVKGDIVRAALIPEGPDPVGVCRPSVVAAFASGDHPVNVPLLQPRPQIDCGQQRLARQETDVRID